MMMIKHFLNSDTLPLKHDDRILLQITEVYGLAF